MFKGAYTALITPFKNGKVDRKGLINLVDWQIAEGIDGLVPVGTTGEATTLSYEEHIEVIKIVVKAARKRVPVMAGTGSNSTEEAIFITRKAKEAGADASLLVNPYYNKPTQEGLKAHFLKVAKSVSIPIVLYNIPSRTGVNMLPPTIAAVAKAAKNIVGVKEATGSIDQASETIQACGPDFCVLSGDDSMTLPMMALGARGVISVASNIVPKTVAQMCSLALDGQFEQARELHHALFPLTKALFIETNPGPVKTAMKMAGLIGSDFVRLPLVNVMPETRAKLKTALKNFGVKVK